MRTGRVLVACCLVLVTVAACKGQATANTAPEVNSVGTNSATTVVFPPPSIPTKPTLIHPSVVVPPPIATAPPVSRPPSTPQAPGQPATTVPPARVDTSGMLRPPDSVRLTHDGRYVVFTDEQSGCQRISAKATSQTAASVTITVTTTTTSHGSQVCPMYVREVPIVVVLDAPLGNRTLVFKGITQHG
jgi:hypothetical protein